MRVVCVAFLGLSLLIITTGCERVSAPYKMKMDRVDQNMAAGNRGYLKGTPPPAPDRGDLKREFIALDVDLIN
ncbi:MAG: hypothetical protein WC515_01285 [Candidatus Omnitrophota bacterium]